GTLPELLRHPESITGKCLRAHKKYPTRGERRPVPCVPPQTGRAAKPRQPAESGKPQSEVTWLKLAHAAKNNLKELTLHFPLGRFVVVTGISGSGKSTLIRECLLPAVVEALRRR